MERPLFSTLALALCFVCSSANVSPPSFESVERNLFAGDIYHAIARDHSNENVVISPAAIQTSMALAHYGAKGTTASEIKNALRLGSGSADDIVKKFSAYQNSFSSGRFLQLVTNIYINENLEFKHDFRDVADRSFNSKVEKADFHPPYNKRTAERINREVSEKTNGKITDIIDAAQMNDLTEGVMVNGAAYSGASWQNAFKADKTKRRDFMSASGRSIPVDTMWTVNNFRHGVVSELDAKVLELVYDNPQYAMLIFMPNRNDGLPGLIDRVANKNLLALADRYLNSEKLEVYLPKFSVSFGTSLITPFNKLGVTTMFTRKGDFGNLYRMFVSHYINHANHKAFVEVREDGSVASLESGSVLSGLKHLFNHATVFDVNHPFLFAIRHQDSIIFMGHIVNV